MKLKKLSLTTLMMASVFAAVSANAATFEGDVANWKKNGEARFSDPQKNFSSVVKMIEDNYADPSLTDEDIYRAATAGVLAALNTGEEKWNKLYSPREVEDLQIELSGHLSGVGAVLSWNKESGHATVDDLIPGSSAEQSGLKRGDEILTVNNEKFKGRTLADMVDRIRGPEGKSVSLRVLRDEDVRTVKITRAAIELADVTSRKFDDGAGYLRIQMFTRKTPAHARDALAALKGCKKLIVDLRNTPGGGFDEALAFAEMFVAKGGVFAKTKDRSGKEQEYRSKSDPWSPDTHVVVLINQETFSGAELVASSLSETRNATLVGEKTFGKWSAQSVETLPNKFAIRYSIIKFESPSGKNYQGEGLKPTFEVSNAKGTISINDWKQSSAKNLADRDPQLKAALAL